MFYGSLETAYELLVGLDNFIWAYLGAPLIIAVGSYFTIRSGFLQITRFPAILKLFWNYLRSKQRSETGVHPLKAFFASVGGCIGIGNVVVICTAIQVGGPGALLWIWVAAILGAMVKFAEVFLGIRYRVSNHRGTYSGGPIYYLQQVFTSPWVPRIVGLLLCVYGVEVLQFNLMAHSIVHNYGLNPIAVNLCLLALVLYATAGGVRRVGEVCGAIIPVFTVAYVGMGLWILIDNAGILVEVFKEVFSSAFTGHASVGAFAGSTLLISMSQGIRRGCYASDVGVGYASMIHSETTIKRPEKQAAFTIMEVFLDTFLIVTTSVLLILVTGVWKEPLHESEMVQTALALYYPFAPYVMPVFLFILGYSTIIAYFCFGLNASEFLSPRYGRKIYYVVAGAALFFFSFAGTGVSLTIMSLTGGLLLMINLTGMFLMRREIHYHVDSNVEL